MGNIRPLNLKCVTPKMALDIALEHAEEFESVLVLGMKKGKLIDIHASFMASGDWAICSMTLQRFVMFDGDLSECVEESDEPA